GLTAAQASDRAHFGDIRHKVAQEVLDAVFQGRRSAPDLTPGLQLTLYDLSPDLHDTVHCRNPPARLLERTG
ncbi:MAG: hypothetical protein AAFX39_03685, partial [Pseudomonadota bacterium]